MPSSTSSSDPRAHEIHRDIPQRAWLSMAAVALVLAFAVLAWWERAVRAHGYLPDYEDGPNLWVPLRQAAEGATKEQIVLVGSSRTMFDLDLDTLQSELGGPRPLQLAKEGSSPMPIFTDLAEDESYAGTTIVGVVPGLFAVPVGPPVETPKKLVRKYHAWSPADAWERPLSLWLQGHLALIHGQDLALPALLGRIELANRPDAQVPKQLPPSFARTDLERRTRIKEWVEADPAELQRIQQIWLPLMTPPPKPPVFTDEQWAKMFADSWNEILAQASKNVAAITSRGGRVIFVQDPSSGGVRELEQRYAPREKFWDRLLAETGAPGITFEDYPELAYECPEWSHLSHADSLEYTERVVAILRREGML